MKLQTELRFRYSSTPYAVVYDFTPNNPIFPDCVKEGDIGFVRLIGKLITNYAEVYLVDVFINGRWYKRNPLCPSLFYAPIKTPAIKDPLKLGRKLSDDRKKLIEFSSPILLEGKWKYKNIREEYFKENMLDRRKETIYVTYMRPKIDGTLPFLRRYNFINSLNVSIVVLRDNQVLTGNAVIGEIKDNPQNNYLVEPHTFEYLLERGINNICKLNEKDRIAKSDGKVVYGSLVFGAEEQHKRDKVKKEGKKK